MFQAKLRGWRRLAAGLVLVPGLTGVGADALGLVSRAAGQERPAANRAEEARELVRQAQKAYDAQNYDLARELMAKASALRAPSGPGPDPDGGERRVARRYSAPPAAAAGSRAAPTDPKVLTVLAKQALEAGDPDRAHDLASQAAPQAASVKWGLFEDTPASILKDVAKARGRRDRDTAGRLLVEARLLLDKPTASRTERVANLSAAEQKARQAAGLNATYSMWDFSDRPADVIADARKAREKENLVAVHDEPADDAPPAPSGYGARTMPRAAEAPPTKPARAADATRRKAAVALMQEAKALEVRKNYVEARKKYAEAARLNAPFARDEDTPETELARLSVAAQRRINGLLDEARTCADRKDAGAGTHLAEAHALATGMGLDASLIVELQGELKPATRVARTKPMPTAGEDAPLPVIKTGARPADEDAPPPVIRNGGPSDLEDLPGVKTAGGEEPPIGPIPPADGADTVKPIPTAKKTGKPDADVPPVPDTTSQAETVKPPMVESLPAKPKAADSDKGQRLLRAAQAELHKGQTESARKLAIDLINGPYDPACQEAAKAIVQSADTAEAGRKIADAKRAFDKAQEAWVSGNYAQALAVFKQIDGALLRADDRKVMGDMMAAAEAQQKKGPVSERLPAAPKAPAGVPDLPAATRTGSDNLVQQQDALRQVEFQRLRTKALRAESEATARFGRGETDAALMDLQNFVAEVKASQLEPAKQTLLCRSIEARMDRLRILKHQTDFLTKESRDRRNFHAEMTQEALAREAKHTDVAKLMKEANQLSGEHKYKEAYAKLQMAQTLDPDDAAVNGAAAMAERLMRLAEVKRADKSQEKFNYTRMNEWHEYPDVTERDPLRWTQDKEYRDTVLKRGPANFGVMRSRSELEKSIERKLFTPITVNFKATPLDGVVSQLHLMTGLNFDLDYRGLKEGNVDPKQPITTDLKDVSLKSALNIICQQAGLKHVIENEAIRISTPKGTSGRQMVKTMSVGDLVMAAPNFGAHPGLSLTDQLTDARNSAYGRNTSMSTPRNPSLPGGTGTGTSSSSGLPGIPGRIRNTPMDNGVNTNGNADGGTLERELIRLITTTIKPDSWSALGGEGTIEYFPLGMTLVINQSPEVIEEVERLLESLRKLQDLEVSIEVKVVSLSETFFERIGVDFSMGIPTNAKPIGGPGTGTTVFPTSNRFFNGNVVGLQVPGVPTPDLDIPIRATSFPRAVPPFGGFNQTFADGGIALGLAFLSEVQVQMFLEAAQGDTRTNVMHAPKLTALNGTSASMTVGDFQFFLTGIQVANVAGQLVFTPQNVPYQVGITQPSPPSTSVQNGLLNFTPQAPQVPGLGLFIQPVVSADRRFVRLNIQQSFVSLISGTQQIPITTIITPVFENGGQGQPVPFTQYLQQPRFSNLETQTVVVVPDGGTVVMGGLKWMTEGRNEFGPPVLAKIPYLNRLFKNVAYGREGRSILIMVTPRVIINREEQERQTGVREDDFVGLVP